ncbi:MAG: hypothetical protein IJD52_04095 [Alphaproteobacteria bacterium]|nr:hypothetical protein [Alphaproteobacteria bacterium]
MWRIYFEVCDFLAGLIPNRVKRAQIRKEKLYDYRKKYNALRCALPRGEFRRVRVIKGGWNIGFIVNNKYVCKIRKYYDKNAPVEKVLREKRITDAFADIVPIKIPRIEIVKSKGFTFYKYDFIPGKNLNRLPLRTIIENGWHWGKQLAQFIDAMHNARPTEINDLISGDGDGWNHNDICNNIIVDKKTMDIVGLIDWEYSGWGTLETEFTNCTKFSKKMQESGIGTAIQIEYHVIQNRRKKNKKI